MKVNYLDNNATTMVAPEVMEDMLPFMDTLYGNPSSMHTFGGQVHKHLNLARQRTAEALDCSPEELIFTSGGTEGDNAAIFAAVNSQPDKRHLITTRVEHPAVLNTCKYLEGRGYEVTYLPVDNSGRLNLEQLRDSLRPDTALVSVMYANNETGNVYPVQAMVEVVKERGILFHTDAVQVIGKFDLSMRRLPVDFLTLSGHKIHAPKGVGAMFVRKKAPFRPFILGGHQENGRRAGTENTAGIVGLGRAMQLAASDVSKENKRVAEQRDRLEEGLLNSVEDARVNGDRRSRLPNTLNISFKYVEGEAILLTLDSLGICASSGSACTSGNLEPSHVLRAMGVPFTHVHSSIRFSLSRYTTEEEVDQVLNNLPGIISRLRAISPFGRDREPQAAC